MSIQSEGQVEVITDRCLLVKGRPGFIYVPRSICPFNVNLGDAVIVRADSWEYKRLSPELRNYNIKYRATSIDRNDKQGELITEEGSVSNILKNKGILIRFGKDEVYCPSEVGTSGIQETDIVRFRAEKWENPPVHLAEKDVRYKCISLEFLRKARMELATGTFCSIDKSGYFGLAEGRLMNDTLIVAYVDVGVVKPSCSDLNEIFSNDTTVKFRAIEQGANRKNDNIYWKAVVATDERYLINDDNSITIDPFFADFEEEQKDPDLHQTTSDRSSQETIHNVTHSLTTAPNVESSSLEQGTSLCEKGPDSYISYNPHGSELEEQNRQLKLLAHYLSNLSGCDYCLQSEI